MKKFLVIFIVFFSITTFAQKQIIFISNKYDFQKEKNSYNINNVLKAVLVANNYQVYFEDEVLPLEVANNKCNALTGVLLDKSNVFLTKVKLQIKDCQNNLLFETSEVKSKEKNVQAGYLEAIQLLTPELKKFKPTIIQKKEVVVLEPLTITSTSTTLKHQLIQITNGFIIFDASQKVVLQIYKTTNPNVFIADRFGVKGVFTKVEDKGFFEYYLNDKLIIEEFFF